MKTPQKIKFEWPILPSSYLKLIYFTITAFCCAVTALGDATGTTTFFGILCVVVLITPLDDEEEKL